MTRHAYTTVGIGVLTCAALIVFVGTLAHAAFSAPMHEMTDAQAAALIASSSAVATAVSESSEEASSTLPAEVPIQIIIPAIHVDADIQKVGLTTKGDMSAPSTFSDAGWYKYGPMPGQPGSAVIDGHVDNGLSLAGVFKHLPELVPGDDIVIVTEQGSRLRFRVTSTESYPYENVPLDELFSRDGPPRLQLITCSGSWVQAGKTYDRRLVVTAELVRSSAILEPL